MRISDWSSDVCSSDLGAEYICNFRQPGRRDIDATVFPFRYLGNADAGSQREFGLRDTARLPERLDVVLHRVRLLHHGQEVARSEEHTSELQSLMRISYAVFCLKKNKNNSNTKYVNPYEYYNTSSMHTT